MSSDDRGKTFVTEPDDLQRIRRLLGVADDFAVFDYVANLMSRSRSCRH